MICKNACLLRSLFATAALSFACAELCPAQTKGDKPNTPQARPEKQKQGNDKLVPLELKLPKPAFKGTPKHVPPGTNLEKPRKGPRRPFLAPKGTKNVALGKKVASSDTEPIIGEIELVTDGDKEANEGSYVELGPGLQWVQIDLKKKYQIQAILVW
ncbi:MAG: hypothetical protein ACE5I3_15825, partial [Phycisphaerae bacterium]